MNRSKNSHHKQEGYLLISAIFLIVIVSFVGVAVSRMMTTQSASTTGGLRSVRSFYLANGGLQSAAYRLLGASFANRLLCSSITGDADFTNKSFGTGEFTVTGNLDQQPNPAAVLDSLIDSVVTTIPVDTVTGYASNGRIMIDQELIDYSGTSTTACSGAPACFTGATRGVGGTTAAAHALGVRVGQNQCSVTSVGGVPDLTAPYGKRSVGFVAPQLPDGWATGNTSGGEVLLRWDGKSWARVGPSSLPNKSLRGIDLISYADGWAVGAKQGTTRSTFFYWDGTNWNRWTGTISPDPLVRMNSVSCVNANDCWAVGQVVTATPPTYSTIMHWDGLSATPNWSQWTGAPLGPIPDALQNLNGIACYDNAGITNCWAVGNRDPSTSNSTNIMHWDGTSWERVDPTTIVSRPRRHLRGISCYDNAGTMNCWAVGDDRNTSIFIHWDGATNIWTRWTGTINNDPDVDMNAISCFDNAGTPNCWAVGDPDKTLTDSTFMFWDGVDWSRITPAASVPVVALRSVKCTSANDCWAVGDTGTLVHYDGATWTDVTSPVTSTLWAVDFFPTATPIHWKENFT